MGKPAKKASKAELIAEYESYPKYPSRFDKKSAKDYEDDGFDQARDYFKGLGKTFRQDAVGKKQVRSSMDALDAEAELQTTMADFWLRLTRTEGRWRRKNEPPENPFQKKGRSRTAPQGKILDWDKKWRKIAAYQAVKKVYENAGAAASISAGAALRATMMWMTTNGGAVVGNVSEMPGALLDKAMAHPERLSIQSLTLEQALRRKWVDAKERVVWMTRFELASQALVSELKQHGLAQVAAETRSGRPRTPDKDPVL